MELTLFKGVSKDQVSLFLEKTSISIRNYDAGETIVEPGDGAMPLRFVLSGEISIAHIVAGGMLTVVEHAGHGRVLGAERVYGIEHNIPARVATITKTAVLELNKEQYSNLLKSDRIYLLNFLNYLSVRAQRPIDCLVRRYDNAVGRQLSMLVTVLTDAQAKSVAIYGSVPDVASYCGVSEKKLLEYKNGLVAEGIAECDADSIKISSRRDFLSRH